jgi:hypothetical protein
MARASLAALLVVAALTAWVADAGAHTIGCPPGQAIRGINFLTHRLVCVSVGTEEIAALQDRVAALEAQNAAQATVIANLLAGMLKSPNDLYSITVGDTGITLAGPDVSIELRNDPGPVPTVELIAGDVLVNAARNTAIASDVATSVVSGNSTNIASGLDTTVTSSRNTNVSSGATTNILSSGATILQGSLVQLNGACAQVARVGDLVVPVGPLLVIDSGSTTVFAC